MGTGGGSGIHVVALGYAITSHHVQANAEYVRQMHDAFDELTGVMTPERGLWDVNIKHLRVPGTVKDHSLRLDTVYDGADASVTDMISWSGVALEQYCQQMEVADDMRPEIRARIQQRHRTKMEHRSLNCSPQMLWV